MEYFERRFRLDSESSPLLLTAIAHHRFNYIHPFPDGNGRVSRLLSHAILHKGGLGAGGLWSISRGLARGLADRGEYKREMDAADAPRQGDLDGRGNLSLRALERWVVWFARIVLDQLTFMGDQFELPGLKQRLFEHAERDLGLRSEVKPVLEALLRQGEVPRGAVASLAGLGERTARELIRQTQERQLLTSSSPKGALHLQFNSDSADRLFPRLFLAQDRAG